jgi:TIR domain-containing protein
MPAPVSYGDDRTGTRRRIHPVFLAMLVLAAGLVPCFKLDFFPHILNLATCTGALLAAAAVVLGTRQGSRPDLALRGRRFANRLLAASLPVLVLLFALRVFPFQYGEPPQTVWVPIGFSKNPTCCPELGDVACLERLSLNDDAIHWCWGSVSVALVRLGLVLSYWGTVWACGLWIGFLQVRRPYASSVNTAEPTRTPTSSAATAFLYDLFVSYSNEDKPFVEDLVRDLKNQGLVIWWDQPWVRAGDSIISMIEEGLLASRRFAVVLSPTACRSQWVKEEINAALAVEKERRQRSSEARSSFVIPILHQDCDVPVFLKDRRHADFRSSYEQGLSELLRHFTGEP